MQGLKRDRTRKDAAIIRHALIAIAYLCVAGAMVMLLPAVPLWAGVSVPGWMPAAALVAIGVLLQAGLMQGGVRRSLERQLEVLAHELASSRLDLDAAREEVAALRDRIDAMPDSGQVVSELKVLQGLLGQLSAKAPEKTHAGPRKAEQPAPTALPAVPAARRGEPLVLMDDAEILTIVEKALRDDKVDLYLQPIVSLPQRKRRFYECFSRIVDDRGRVITPEQYIPLAEKEGIVAVIDNMLLFRCIQLVRRAVRDHVALAFFCNISNRSLTDVDFFQDFIEFMADNRQLAPNLLFEFDQQTVTDPSYETQINLQRLADLGFHFSLDQVRDLDLDLPRLAKQGFKYVKIDAHLLHEMARGDRPRLDMRAFKGALDRCAMDLIVEKIESEEMLLDLLDLKIDFGQGYLFGEPRPTAPHS